MNIGEKIVELRKGNNYTQEKLANKLNITRQTLSNWESNVTSPDLEQAKRIAELFNISLDELTGNEIYKNTTQKYNGKIRMEYEYKSKTKIKGIPLVHINVGFGVKKAKGIIAIGNIAQGLISIGGISMGLIAVGGLGIGLILAIGGISLGTISIGGLSLGVFAIGGCAIGIYAIGGVAFAKNIAMGGYSSGHIAIGEQVNGTYKFIVENGVKTFTSEEVKNTILKEFPKTLKIIVSIFSNV